MSTDKPADSSHDAPQSVTRQDVAGWQSDLPTFEAAESAAVCMRLADFVSDADDSQKHAWRSWVPQLQRQAHKLLSSHPRAADYTAILEYRMPRDFRRPDVIVLEEGVVVVLELKGLQASERAGLDQVLAYARDLRAYHEECHDRPVVPILVRPTASDEATCLDGAWVVSPTGISQLLKKLATTLSGVPLSPSQFLRDDAYCPLPSIVDAARELFEQGYLRTIREAHARTEPALAAITAIAKEAKCTHTRHLVVLTGVPGSGKTLVGLQIVHARWLDALASPDGQSRPRSPAVYLSGTGPLVQVLQDALSAAGGGGQTFVQAVKKYVSHYSKKNRIPPEHVVVFDEAQRAHDPDQFAEVHKLESADLSEPDHLVAFMQRVPDWCVLVALVGTGQAIHVGEEVGLPLWRDALFRHAEGQGWVVHAPAAVANVFSDGGISTRITSDLDLDTELRHHLVPRVHELVEHVLADEPRLETAALASCLHGQGLRFLLTRNLAAAQEYLQERYADSPAARYGLIASSRCKRLAECGVDNTYQTTKRLKVGRWYNASATEADSCCRLASVATEFQTQGLELDMAVLSWGTDFRREAASWSDAMATGYKKKKAVRDSLALRRNAYRVLLTRGRDGTVLFVPPIPEMDETWKWFCRLGLVHL
jgi:hypothetical protein